MASASRSRGNTPYLGWINLYTRTNLIYMASANACADSGSKRDMYGELVVHVLVKIGEA